MVGDPWPYYTPMYPVWPNPPPALNPPSRGYQNVLDPDREARAMETLAAAINRLADALGVLFPAELSASSPSEASASAPATDELVSNNPKETMTQGLPQPMSAERVEQREDDDCTICAIAMATGLPYEAVMAQARVSSGGYRYGGTPGTMSPKGVLIDLGFAAKRLGCEGDGQGAGARNALWGRRAILSVPSLNGFTGHHDVYWDGKRVWDPSPKGRYPEELPRAIHWATLLDETAPTSDSLPNPTLPPQGEG